MSFIYKITNLINNQVYIGLTTRTVESRWKEHCRRKSQEVDKAIAEYGKENFTIETIEECNEEDLDAREKYWIAYYDSFNNGYNNTLGGRNDNYVATDKVNFVLLLWSQGLTVNKIVQQTGLNVETVRSYLNKNNINHEDIRIRANQAIKQAKSIPVLQFDKNGNFIQEWSSAKEAGKQLNLNDRNIRSVCSGLRKTCGNYIWKYKEKNK